MTDYLIAVGSNLPTSRHATPLAVCEAAVEAIGAAGFCIVAQSRWFRTAPVPLSDQPWFVNGVLRVHSLLAPAQMLDTLHKIETAFGRIRRIRWEARVLDLDLIAADDLVQEGPPILPHPRMGQRAFVLLPLHDVAPDWVHPVTGQAVTTLIAELPAGQGIEVMPE